MNQLTKHILISCFICILLTCNAFADTTQIEDEVAGKQIIGNLDNGTLYNKNIHHRRPTSAIKKSWSDRKKISLVDNIDFSLYSNFTSRYVSHALASSDGFVWQPSGTVEWYGLGFSVWADFVLDDIPDQGKFNEVDLTLYYNYETHGFTIHPYILFCLYPTSNKLSLDYSAYTDIEPSLHLAYTTGPVSFFTDLTYYVHPKNGALILEMGLGLQHKIPLHFGIEMSGLFAMSNSRYNKPTFGVSETNFSYFEFSLGIPWNPIKGLIVKPNVNVTTMITQKIRNAVAMPVLVFGGVNLAYNF